jgi:hypothetical protein
MWGGGCGVMGLVPDENPIISCVKFQKFSPRKHLPTPQNISNKIEVSWSWGALPPPIPVPTANLCWSTTRWMVNHKVWHVPKVYRMYMGIAPPLPLRTDLFPMGWVPSKFIPRIEKLWSPVVGSLGDPSSPKPTPNSEIQSHRARQIDKFDISRSGLSSYLP